MITPRSQGCLDSGRNIFLKNCLKSLTVNQGDVNGQWVQPQIFCNSQIAVGNKLTAVQQVKDVDAEWGSQKKKSKHLLILEAGEIHCGCSVQRGLVNLHSLFA